MTGRTMMTPIGREGHYTRGTQIDLMTGMADTMDTQGIEDQLMMTDMTGLERTMTLMVDTDRALEEDLMIGEHYFLNSFSNIIVISP